MIKFTKLAIAAALVATPMVLQAAEINASGVGGTGVDFVGAITPVANNPGVAAPGGTVAISFGGFGVVRGIFSVGEPVTFTLTGENAAGATLN